MSEFPTDQAVSSTGNPPSSSASAAFWPAMFSRNAHLRFWLFAAVALVLDLTSKYWAFYLLGQGPGSHRVVIPHVLELQTMFNKGALFGIGQGQTQLFLAASVLALGLVLWMFARSDARRWVMHIALGAILAGALGNMYDRIFVQLYEHRVPGGAVYFEQVGRDGDIVLLREYPPGNPGSIEIPVPLTHLDEYGPRVGCVRDFLKIPTKLPRWISEPLGRPADQDLWPWVFNIADMLLVGGVAVLAIFLWRDGEPAKPKSAATGTDAAASS
jgi:lipoprotein signal peptidase